jgi:hypothetical protein
MITIEIANGMATAYVRWELPFIPVLLVTLGWAHDTEGDWYTYDLRIVDATVKHPSLELVTVDCMYWHGYDDEEED